MIRRARNTVLCNILFFCVVLFFFFFFNDTATTEIYTLSLHDALPILVDGAAMPLALGVDRYGGYGGEGSRSGLVNGWFWEWGSLANGLGEIGRAHV